MIRRTVPLLALIVSALVLSLSSLAVDNLDDAFLEEVRAGFEDRQSEVLQVQMMATFPGPTDPAPGNGYAWNKLNFALAILYNFRNDPESNPAFINAANKAIIDASKPFLDDSISGSFRRESIHWHGNHWVRIHELFASDSSFYPGLLTEEAESAIREFLWFWASNEVQLVNADIQIGGTWNIWGSENHSAMRDSTAWGAAKILRRFEPYKSMAYADGSTPQQQYEAWTEFLIEYMRERGRRGMFVEYRATAYVKYTMQNFYNYFDLSENPTMRELARTLLDLMWADAALETFDGFAGGAATRIQRPQEQDIRREPFANLNWHFYGLGTPRNQHPGHMMLVTTNYRIPKVIMDIALDREGRGSYEYISRRPGQNVEGKEYSWSQTHYYFIDYEDSEILRYSYVTPDFMLGSHFFPNLPSERWSGIQQSNRYIGALIKTTGTEIREGVPVNIFPQGVVTASHQRSRNEQWSIQKLGTLITQKLRTSGDVLEMRVYLPNETDMDRREDGDWLFLWNEYAYVGIRTAFGGYKWVDLNWIELNEEFSPIIMEVARAGDYLDIDAFVTAAKNAPMEVVNVGGLRQLNYTGLGESGVFTFAIDGDALPTVNGSAYNLAPEYTYKSPYVNADWPASEVTIEKGEMSRVLNFELDYPKTGNLNAQWQNSFYVDYGWYHLDGFGFFRTAGDWVFLPELGWAYAPESSSGIWLYVITSEKWVWTAQGLDKFYELDGTVHSP